MQEASLTLGIATSDDYTGKGTGENPGALTERSPPRWLRTLLARWAVQVAPGRGREFESRSRKGLRLQAAPAHCQRVGGPGRGQLRARPLGIPVRARLPRARQEVGAERSPGCGGREGGSEGGADQEFFQWVETWARGWNPANWKLGGGRGAFAGTRAEGYAAARLPQG